MSLSKQILLGLVAGLSAGLFFGEKVAFLEWPAKAFIQLLQVTVLPYIVTSLIYGIAHGSPGQVRRLASRGGLVIGFLWIISLALVFLSPLALPPEKGGSFFASAELTGEPQIDWLDLYIPSNPFRSLANNVVPAVVVFSILVGVALLGLPGKERILGPLALVNDSLGRAGSLLVRLTPIGLFAIAGHSAGTLRIEEFERLQAFLLVYVGLSLILTLWILPGLISALTGLSYRRILSLVQDPLLTAFVTANLFIVLPLLEQRAKQLLAEADLKPVDADEAVDVLVPASFTFPHSSKLLSLVFILFAGWFAGAPVSVRRFPAVAGAGLLSLFGSLNTAVPFLLDLARLPADLFQLFVVSSVLNSRFGTAAAAMHTLALALIGAPLIAGQLRINRARLIGLAAGTVAIVGLFLVGSRLLLSSVLPVPESTGAMLDRLRITGAWGTLAAVEVAKDATAEPGPSPSRGHRLEEILKRGKIRVCFSDDAVPWCFRNSHGDVVGFEVDLAHMLAVNLNLRLVLVPVERIARKDALECGACDVAVGRIMPSQSGNVMFSRPITLEAWAFLVEDHLREVFASLDLVRQLPRPRIAIFQAPEWIARMKAMVPNAEVMPVSSIPEFIKAPQGSFDAMYTGFERATAFSLLYPKFSAVIPEPNLGSVPIALIVPHGEEELLGALNAWIEEEQANGLIKQKLDYWVHGKGTREELEPRWSVARDVLGWWRN